MWAAPVKWNFRFFNFIFELVTFLITWTKYGHKVSTIFEKYLSQLKIEI